MYVNQLQFISHLRCIFLQWLEMCHCSFGCHILTWLAASPFSCSHVYFPSNLLLQQAGANVVAISRDVYKSHWVWCFVVVGHHVFTEQVLSSLSLCICFFFFSLILVNPWRSEWRRVANFTACKHVRVCKLRCYLAFYRFHYARKTKSKTCTAAGHLFEVGLLLVVNELWTNRESELNGQRNKKKFFLLSFLYSSPLSYKKIKQDISPCPTASRVYRSPNTLVKLTNTEI